MSTKRQIKRKKKPTIGEDIASMRQWQQDHEKHDDERQAENVGEFKKGRDKMATLATKDDLSVVMLDQASKKDMDTLTKALFDEEGKPRFATREDVFPVVDFYKKIMLTAQITNGSGKWFARFIIGGTSLLIALGALWVFAKSALIWLITRAG